MTSSSSRRGPLRRRSSGLLRSALRRYWPEVVVRSTLMAGIILACLYIATLSRNEASVLFRVVPAVAEPAISDTDIETLVRLAGSRQVLDGADNDPTLIDLPWYRDAVRVERVRGLPLVQIIARGTPDQAPRIVAAVAASVGRIRNQAIQEDSAITRGRAAQRLHELQTRSDQLEQFWQNTVDQRVAAVAQGATLKLDLHDLAKERVAVRVGMFEAERELVEPTTHPLDLTQLQPVNAAEINLRRVGWFWMAMAVGPVVMASIGAMVTLAMATEARERRRVESRQVSAPATMLVAIQLVHGDWHPRRHSPSS